MAEMIQVQPQYILLWQQISRTMIFHRLAGLSGCLSIIFTAYIENCKLPRNDKHFLTLANHINYIHTLVLMAVPLTRRPNLVNYIAKVFYLLKISSPCSMMFLFFVFPFNHRQAFYFWLEWVFIVSVAISVHLSNSMDTFILARLEVFYWWSLGFHCYFKLPLYTQYTTRYIYFEKSTRVWEKNL